MELDITVFGIGLIVVVVVVDLIIGGLKKKTKSTEVDVITEEKIEKKTSTDIFSYIINRKRNIVSMILLTIIFKVFIHFFVFPIMVKTAVPNPNAGKIISPAGYRFGNWEEAKIQRNIMSAIRPATIGYHVERTLTTRLDLFAYSFGGLLVVVFLFNDKIKAR